MSIEELQNQVDDLYKFRDEYFSFHGPEEASKKEEKIAERLSSIMEFCESLQGTISPIERGKFHFLKGRALNVAQDYNSLAEEELGKATKFNFSEAWNELGECQYKKGDFLNAKMCFEKALAIETKSVYLRNMSLLMRSLPFDSQKDKEDNIIKGHSFAKEALKLDITDGHSWLVLGNSFLASFFCIEAKQETLKNCKAAYQKAEEDTKAAHLPELHYSKFQVAWYEEEYRKSLQCLEKAIQLEPSWEDLQKKMKESRKFLTQLSMYVHSKGKLNKKKISSMSSSIKPSQLGPYEHSGTAITSGVKPDLTPLSLLADGVNNDKIILGKVVCTVVPDSGLPFAFCIVDKDETCRAVTVYNWASSCGVKIGDSVAIVAPVLKFHRFDSQQIQDFASIRVALPLMMVVNKRPVTSRQIITTQVVSQKKPD